MTIWSVLDPEKYKDAVESPTGWITPRRKDYEWECCVCGHRDFVDFRVNRKYKSRDIIQIRVKPYRLTKKVSHMTKKESK